MVDRTPRRNCEVHAISSSRETVLQDDFLLQTILTFLPHTFRFTAAVNTLFYKAYLSAHISSKIGQDRSKEVDSEHRTSPTKNPRRSTITSYANGVETVETARLWLQEDECDAGVLFIIAVRHERLEIMTDMHMQGWIPLHVFDWGGVRYDTVQNGRIEVLGWALEHQYISKDSDVWIIRQSAALGKLEVLGWARANGCSQDDLTCCLAAQYGHLDVLKWARSNCGWDRERALLQAERHGHREVCAWILSQN